MEKSAVLLHFDLRDRFCAISRRRINLIGSTRIPHYRSATIRPMQYKYLQHVVHVGFSVNHHSSC